MVNLTTALNVTTVRGSSVQGWRVTVPDTIRLRVIRILDFWRIIFCGYCPASFGPKRLLLWC